MPFSVHYNLTLYQSWLQTLSCKLAMVNVGEWGGGGIENLSFCDHLWDD